MEAHSEREVDEVRARQRDRERRRGSGGEGNSCRRGSQQGMGESGGNKREKEVE